MSRGVDQIEGWPAVAWVAGMGVAVIGTAGLLWLRSRSFPDRPPEAATYRSPGGPGSRTGSDLRGLALVLTALCALSQLLYCGLYVVLGEWLLRGTTRPRITIGLFFWVFLVNGTCVGASLYKAWTWRALTPSRPAAQWLTLASCAFGVTACNACTAFANGPSDLARQKELFGGLMMGPLSLWLTVRRSDLPGALPILLLAAAVPIGAIVAYRLTRSPVVILCAAVLWVVTGYIFCVAIWI